MNESEDCWLMLMISIYILYRLCIIYRLYNIGYVYIYILYVADILIFAKTLQNDRKAKPLLPEECPLDAGKIW